MKRKTKLETLIALIPDGRDVWLEFRAFNGWFLCGELRFIGDDGADFIGRNAVEAEKFLKWLYRKETL